MANGFAATDATGATVEIASISVTAGGVTGQGQAFLLIDSANNNLAVIDSGGALSTKARQSTTATKTNISAAVANTALIASNSSRLGASVFNDSTSAMYVNLGSSASTTAFVVKLAAASYYEIPFGYTGAINGYWDTATGSARVCEYS